jgi:hypothetical protein
MLTKSKKQLAQFAPSRSALRAEDVKQKEQRRQEAEPMNCFTSTIHGPGFGKKQPGRLRAGQICAAHSSRDREKIDNMIAGD